MRHLEKAFNRKRETKIYKWGKRIWGNHEKCKVWKKTPRKPKIKPVDQTLYPRKESNQIKKGEVRERGLPEIKRIMGKIILANELEEKYKKIFEKLKQK